MRTRAWVVLALSSVSGCGGGMRAAAPEAARAPGDEDAGLATYVRLASEATVSALDGRPYDRAFDCAGEPPLGEIDADARDRWAALGPKPRVAVGIVRGALSAPANGGAWLRAEPLVAFVLPDARVRYRVAVAKGRERGRGERPLAEAPPAIRAAFDGLLASVASSHCAAPLATDEDLLAVAVPHEQRTVLDPFLRDGVASVDACGATEDAAGPWSISGIRVDTVVSGQGPAVGVASTEVRFAAGHACLASATFALLSEAKEEEKGGERDVDADDDEKPANEPAQPSETPPAPMTTPPNDRDGDGVPDDQDACPDSAGQPTNDPKSNGCP